MPILSDAPYIAGEGEPAKPQRQRKPASAKLQAYRDYIKANCSKMPGKTPQERLKQCAAEYQKTKKADVEPDATEK